MSKGQMPMGELVGIILVLIAFGLVLGIGVKGCTAGLGEQTSFDACKSSNAIRMAAKVRLGAVPGSDAFSVDVPLGPLSCTTWDKTLKGDRESIEKDMGTLIAKCWDQFLEGEYDGMFADYDNYYNRCFICYTVNIEDITDDTQIDMDELRIKLKDIDYVQKRSGKTYKVLDYVQKNGFIGYPGGLKLTEKKPTYAIAFVSESLLTETALKRWSTPINYAGLA